MSEKAEIRKALQSGRPLTQLDCLILFKTTAGQQRINELRRDGDPIRDEWIKTATGKRVKQYRWAGQVELGL